MTTTNGLLTHDEAIQRLRDTAAELGSQNILARALGVNSGYLSSILTQKHSHTGWKLLERCGYERVVMYRPPRER